MSTLSNSLLDLSFLDMLETSASRGNTTTSTGCDRAAPRRLWQHNVQLTTAGRRDRHGYRLGTTFGGNSTMSLLHGRHASVNSDPLHDLYNERCNDMSRTMQRMVLEGAARSVEREKLWNEQSLEEKLIERVTRLRGRCFCFTFGIFFVCVVGCVVGGVVGCVVGCVILCLWSLF
jgi:hypothetical protein